MSYDLTIQTQRANEVPSKDYVTSVHNELRRVLGGIDAVHEFCLFGPDANNAKWFLEEDGFYDLECKRRFEVFCQQRHLATHPLSAEVALAFWTHEEGVHLATVSLPRDDQSCSAIYRALIDFARGSTLRLADPQMGSDIDLHNPGEFPPMWT